MNHLLPYNISTNTTAIPPLIELVKPSTPHNMNRQEENAVVDSMDPQAKDRLVALLAVFQQLVDDYSRVAVERSRIFAGARDATKAATAAFESNTLSAAEVYARVTRIKTETGIAARAQKHPQTRIHGLPPLRS
jgi:hypothetical protein